MSGLSEYLFFICKVLILNSTMDFQYNCRPWVQKVKCFNSFLVKVNFMLLVRTHFPQHFLTWVANINEAFGTFPSRM
jgi:hypothetical protein